MIGLYFVDVLQLVIIFCSFFNSFSNSYLTIADYCHAYDISWLSTRSTRRRPTRPFVRKARILAYFRATRISVVLSTTTRKTFGSIMFFFNLSQIIINVYFVLTLGYTFLKTTPANHPAANAIKIATMPYNEGC